MTIYHSNCDLAAKQILEKVGKKIVMGVPIGIGKPIGLLNAIYRLACADPHINLIIVTGLTLSRPHFKPGLEKNFAEPIVNRLIQNYEDPLYEQDRLQQKIPANIKIIEFYLTPAKYLNNAYSQQHYISSSYSDILRDTLIRGMNVIAQQVAFDAKNNQYSLSSNADLFCDAVMGLKQLEKTGSAIAIIGEVNQQLPFMHGEAIIQPDTFTHIIDTGHYPHLFALPRESLSWQDQLIGMYTSCLIKDDGCLQLGIGKLSNAITSSLILREKNNTVYQAILSNLKVHEKFNEVVQQVGDTGVFQKGLYASTEMLCDGYLYLYREKILKKRVYDHVGLQALLNTGVMSETITSYTLPLLIEHHLINAQLSDTDVSFLNQFGIFKERMRLDGSQLITAQGEKLSADLSLPANLAKLEPYLGKHLTSGKIVHAGFFVGSNDFYQGLRELSYAELQTIDMTTVSRTNSTSWLRPLAELQRINARFVNTCMMVTLGGELVSDAIENRQEISGVGGQYDFVNMARGLSGARSIITCRSTRFAHGKLQSNIVWEYPNITIPRYLRDIVVTEYGIADCRGKTDSEVIKALLQITDSRFQPRLLEKAKQVGKVEKDYEIPAAFQQNYPHSLIPIIEAWQKKGYFKSHPFGSDLTKEEFILEKALMALKNLKGLKLIKALFASLLNPSADKNYEVYLDRMQLSKPLTLKEKIYKILLKNQLTPMLEGKKAQASEMN